MSIRNVLLLEGFTDRELFSYFAKIWSLSINCHPKTDGGSQFKGVDHILKHLPSFLNGLINDGDSIDRLGICVDSDDDPIKRKQDIEAHLSTFGFVNPSKAGSGWVYKHETKKDFFVGVLILPSIDDSGELEDVLVNAIHSPTKTHFSHCDNLISKLQSDGLRQNKKSAKAKIYTLLASQDEPSANFSYLGSDNLIDINHPSIQGIKTWLEEVYK